MNPKNFSLRHGALIFLGAVDVFLLVFIFSASFVSFFSDPSGLAQLNTSYRAPAASISEPAIVRMRQPLADLMIDRLSSRTDFVGEGAVISLDARIRNRGAVSAPGVLVRFWLEGSSDMLKSIALIDSGEAISAQAVFTVPLSTVKDLRWHVCADPTAIIPEEKEDNNCRQGTLSV